MFTITRSRLTRTVLASSVIAAVAVTACNDSKASSSSENAAPQAAKQLTGIDAAVSAATAAGDINQRNHVCFTMDVNNVKCVLGDIVAYVPQGILESDKADLKDNGDKTAAKSDKKKDKDADEKAKAEADAKAQLLANQRALNEARSLVFVAKYCDMDKSVVYSKEGVACTFKPHALYDAGATAELEQYKINLLNAQQFFDRISKISGIEHFSSADHPGVFGEHGGYRLFLSRGDAKDSMKISDSTRALIVTKRLDINGNVLGLYQEELTFENLNAQMKVLTSGLVKGDHVKLVFDTSLDKEQPLWRTTSLEFGQPYVWEVEVKDVGEKKQESKSADSAK